MGHREDNGIVPQLGVFSAPRGHIGDGVGPQDGDAPRIRRVQAISAGAHPVVGVAQGNAADGVLVGQLHRPLHAEIGVEVAGTVLSVVPLHNAGGLHQHRDGVHLHAALFHALNKLGEPVQPVGIHPVQAGVGVKLGGTGRPLRGHAVLGKHPDEFVVHVFVWYTHWFFSPFSAVFPLASALQGPYQDALVKILLQKRIHA